MLDFIRKYFKRNSLDKITVKKIEALEKTFGFSVGAPSLYLKALRHRSRLIEDHLADTESYEQLEFLGDAVLDLIVTEIIFDYYPDENEGFMTRLRSRMVKEQTLAELSRQLGFDLLIEVGNRVKGQGIELKESVLCDIFEAVTGAVYKDKGLEVTRKFIRTVYSKYVDIDNLSSTHDNYKSLLLEYSQAKKLSIPEYRVISEKGPDHDKTFEIEAVINGEGCGTGIGKNKKKAEQTAAMHALKTLKARHTVDA